MRTILRVVTGYLAVAAVFIAFTPAAFAQYECQLGPGAQVTGSLTVADPDQNTRVFRGGTVFATNCLSNAAPAGTPIAGTFNHDAIAFTNTGPAGCLAIRVDTTCGGTNRIFVVAYSTFNPATPNTGIIGNIGASPIAPAVPGFFSFPIAAGATVTVVVSEVDAGAGCASYTLTGFLKTDCRQPGFDRNNDGTTDFAVYRPGNPSLWLNKPTAGGAVETRSFGMTGDIPAHGDYLGNGFGTLPDGLTDLAVYRPSNNRGYAAYNQTNPGQNVTNIIWGQAGDIPVPGDYDGDGAHDVMIFRPSTGDWWGLDSSTFTVRLRNWGLSGDTPVSGDFDGDGLGDLALARLQSGGLRWYILLSNFNYSSVYITVAPFSVSPPTAGKGFLPAWGQAGDKLVPADYDGDGRTDIAVWRPSDGVFYIRLSGSGTFTTAGIQWGMSGDIPQPGDYNNDDRHDVAVYRPSNNTFYVLLSGSGTALLTTLGQAGDEPVSAPYRIQ